MIKKKLYLCFVFILTGCTAHTGLLPVGKHKIEANAGFGGPIVAAFGTRVPVPYTTAGACYGLADNINVQTNLHLLPLAYELFGCDIGVTWFPVLHHNIWPTVGLETRMLVFNSFKATVKDRFRGYPVLSGTAAWPLGKGYFYTGADLTTPFTNADYDSKAATTIVSPYIGYRWNLGKKTRLLTELKWNGANVKSNETAVEYLPISGHGAISTLFSLERSFK